MRMDNGFIQLLGLGYFFSGDVNYCDGGLVDWTQVVAADSGAGPSVSSSLLTLAADASFLQAKARTQNPEWTWYWFRPERFWCHPDRWLRIFFIL